MSEPVQKVAQLLRAECLDVFGTTWSNDVAERFARVAMNETGRQTLEEAAQRLEAMGGNELYKRAYRKAARVIRSMKDFNGPREILNDTQEQISSTSTRPVGA